MGAPMSRIVGFVDQSPCAADVQAAAQWIGRFLDAAVEIVHVAESENHDSAGFGPGVTIFNGTVEEVILREIASSDVIASVVGSRSVAAKAPIIGHVTEALLTLTTAPLVVVPPGARRLSGDAPEIFVPLDGTDETAQALLPTINLLAEAGARTTIAHVFDAESLPPFISSHEDLDILAREFAQQHLPGLSPSCKFRLGDAGRNVADLVSDVGADAVLVAWHQTFTPGRAEVLRRLLIETRVPLIIVAIAARSDTGSSPIRDGTSQ